MQATLNGHDVALFVDTGSFHTTVVPETVDLAGGLYVNGFEYIHTGGIGGPARSSVAEFQDVEVAGGTTHDKRVFVLSDRTRRGFGADGLLAWRRWRSPATRSDHRTSSRSPCDRTTRLT